MEEKLTEMHEQLVNGLGTVISRLERMEQDQQGVVERITQLEEASKNFTWSEISRIQLGTIAWTPLQT